MNTLRAAIIGGGPGGLFTAFLLQQRAPSLATVTLLEATDRLGGKICSPHFASGAVRYEAGAAELYDYSQTGPDPLRELVRHLGLGTRPMVGRTVVCGSAWLRTEADLRRHLGERAHAAIEAFGCRARAMISPRDYYHGDRRADAQGPLSGRTLGDLLSGIGDEAARAYLKMVIHSDLATEPHLTSATYGLHNYLMNEPGYMSLYAIEGGLERLPRELAARIRARVLLGHRVVRVDAAPDGRYRLSARTRDGTAAVGEFDVLIVALPHNWIPQIEWAGGGLNGALYEHYVRHDAPGHYLRVSLLFRRPFWRDQVAGPYFVHDAFGGCCVYDEGSRGNAAGGDGDAGASAPGVLGWLLAGEAALSLSNLPDAALVERVLDSLPADLARGRELVVEGRVHRWVGSISGCPGGPPMRDPALCHLPDPANHPRLFVVGDYLSDSTINGVLDSADAVTDAVIKQAAR